MSGINYFSGLNHRPGNGSLSNGQKPLHLFGRIARLPREARHMKFILITFILLTLSALTHGASLEDVYRAARDNDPVLGAAVAGRLARKQAVVQSRASLLPTVTASGSKSEQTRAYGSRLDMNPASPTFGQTYQPEDEDFEGHNWSVNLRQPIVNVASWFNWRSAKALSSQADSDYQTTQLALYTRVAEAYLNVLRAQARLDSTLATEEAVKRQLEQTQQRFDVGLVAITDVLEATAAYDNAVVNRIHYRNRLRCHRPIERSFAYCESGSKRRKRVDQRRVDEQPATPIRTRRATLRREQLACTTLGASTHRRL